MSASRRPRRLSLESLERREMMATNPVTVVENTTLTWNPLDHLGAMVGTMTKVSAGKDSVTIRCGDKNDRVEVHVISATPGRVSDRYLLEITNEISTAVPKGSADRLPNSSLLSSDPRAKNTGIPYKREVFRVDVQGVTGAQPKIVFLGGAGDDSFAYFADSTFYTDSNRFRILAEGGPGMDVLIGGKRSDILIGGSEIDQLYGNSGNDILFGGDGDDKLVGGPGDDMLFGESGIDTLQGDQPAMNLGRNLGDRDGNDLLDGGQGDGQDKLNGGTGVDLFVTDSVPAFRGYPLPKNRDMPGYDSVMIINNEKRIPMHHPIADYVNNLFATPGQSADQRMRYLMGSHRTLDSNWAKYVSDMYSIFGSASFHGLFKERTIFDLSNI